MRLVFDKDALRKARTDAGLTQMEVSERTEIPQTTLSSYEMGRGEPTVKAMKALSSAYGVRFEDLLAVCFVEVPDDADAGVA